MYNNDCRKEFSGYLVKASVYDFNPKLAYTRSKKSLYLLKDALKLDFSDSITQIHVTVKNTSNKIAFFTQVKLADRVNAMPPATFYTDNYFSLLPGEVWNITIEVSRDKWNKARHLSVAAFNAGKINLKL